MITLYGWGPMFDCPSPSPYVMKTLIQLQMLGVDFQCAMADLETVSKGKAPYLDDDGMLIQDSNFIRSHFEKKLGKSLDAGLSDQEKSANRSMQGFQIRRNRLVGRWNAWPRVISPNAWPHSAG